MIKVTDANFISEVKNSPLVLVDFSAKWCKPCKLLEPILDELMIEMQDIKFVKIDVDRCPNAVNEYNIQSVPSIFIFRDGEVIGRRTGLISKKDMITWINETRK